MEGLFFGLQVPFDEINMDNSEYYRACDKVDKIKEEILKKYPDLQKLMIEMLKELK